MSFLVRPAFVAVTHSTSLGNGRYANGLAARLERDLRQAPQCKGPLRVHDMGHGGWTSANLLADAAAVAALNPTHIVAEGGAINDSVDTGGGPAISRVDHNANNAARYALWLAAHPDVDITVQTMSSVSALVATIRPDLAGFYADEVAQADLLGFDYLDHYAAWPKPLDGNLTHGATTFGIAPTATYDPMPDGTTWNAADKSANMTIASDGLTLSNTGAGKVGIRATAAMTGKEHYEFTWGAKTISAGVADATAALTDYIGSDAHGLAIFGNGNVFRNNANQGASGLGALVAGDLIAVEVDRVANNAYFMKGATRSAAFSIAALGADVFPAVSLNDAGAGGAAHFVTVGDGLHPLFTGAVDTYTYPALLAHLTAKMAAYWPD